MPAFNSLAKLTMGSFSDSVQAVSDGVLDVARAPLQLSSIDNSVVKGYVSPYTPGGFKAGDFQIGSVILPVGPSAVRVNHIRDVQTIPVLRGASIPARVGEGVTTIDMTIDFPDYTSSGNIPNPLTAMIAEFKVSPFTMIRNRDLSSKVSQVNLHEIPAVIRSALDNIRSFTSAERLFRKQFDTFFRNVDDIGNNIAAEWQVHLKIAMGDIIANISVNPGRFKSTAIDNIEGSGYDTITSGSNNPIDILGALRLIFNEGARPLPQAATSSKDEFGDKTWGFWTGLWTKEQWVENTSTAIKAMIKASQAQQAINAAARENIGAEHAKKPPIFIPVVLTRMVFNTKPGSPRCARVDLSFELFNFTAYVDKFEWHHFDENTGLWTTTEDASKADLLLRWRDQQFLAPGRPHHGYVDMSKITLDEINSTTPTNMERLSTGSTIPGYFKYMRAAWKNRRCMSPSSDPADHGLKLLYPEAIPQIHNAAAQANSGFYRELILDDSTSKLGITTGVTVVWDLGIARQVDEFTGNVVHQAVGGSALHVSFQISIPVHETPTESDAVKPHEELVGRINRMFDTIEQNRRILPSEAFMPTSVFVLNPITQMFGAYVFEAGDMPVTQYEPGCVKITMQLSEAIPVVGLGQVLPQHLNSVLSLEGSLKLALGLYYFLREHNTTSSSSAFDVQRLMQQKISGAFGIRASMPFAKMSEPPRDTINSIKPLGKYLQLFTYTGGFRDRTPLAKPWSILSKGALGFSWHRFHSEYSKLYGLGQIDWYNSAPRDIFIKEMDLSEVFDRSVLLAVLRYLDPTTNTGDTKYNKLGTSFILSIAPKNIGIDTDVIHELIKDLDWFRQDNKTIADRLSVIKGDLVLLNNVDKKLIDEALAIFPTGLIPKAQEFLRKEGLYTGDLLALINNIELRRGDGLDLGAQGPSTYMLYPDMILPTVREILDIDPQVGISQIDPEHITHFIPSFAEYGIVTTNEARQQTAGRGLDDLADPDVWYARQTEKPISQKNADTYENSEEESFLDDGGPSPRTLPGVKETSFSKMPSSLHRKIADGGPMGSADFLASVDIEQLAKPNRKRMLFAFPTYTLEFTLDGQKAHRLNESSNPPLNWEARFLNFLPVVKLEVSLDASRPNIANVDFISRRAALRNESWHWLNPDIPIEEETFTNVPERIIEILNEDFPTRSDPTLLTKLILATGSRVSVRMGYGTDINNSQLLPIILSGTIGEISLGEVSNMKLQDIGMQLVNPLEKKIGGSGNWSLNHVWSGKITMRAFTDIFSGLDTKFMGRTARGTEIDIIKLTNQEINRIYEIGVQTRDTIDNILAAGVLRGTASFARDVLHSNYLLLALGILAVPTMGSSLLLMGGVIAGRTVIGSEPSETEEIAMALLEDKTGRFFPELLNVFPTVTGMSDWAISNTDTKGLSATYWIDMISRLNPGCIWWTHPFGNESRLFFGRPEQYYRKYPLVASGSDASAFYQLRLSQANRDLEDKDLSPESFARKLASGNSGSVQVSNVFDKEGGLKTRQMADLVPNSPGYIGYAPRNHEGVIQIMRQFEATINQPDMVDDYYKDIWIQLVNFELIHLTGKSGFDYFVSGPHSPADSRALMRKRAEEARVFNPGLEIAWAIYPLVAIFGYLTNNLDNTPVSTGLPVPYHEEFGNIRESFSMYLRELSRVTVEDGDLDEDTLPGVISHRMNLHFHGLLLKFAGLLNRALQNKELNRMLTKVQQVTKPLSVARHVLGYRRFSEHHHIVSGKSLLTNRIIVSQAKMANAVQVDSYTVGYSVLPFERRVVSIDADLENLNFGVFQWFKGLIGENDRDRVLGTLIPNALARGMARMYDGIIEVRGDPQIKPHDILYILDLHNGVYGPVKCKTVMHSLDSVGGFITRIVPELHTQSFSSRVLSRHVAAQRIMKASAATLVTGGAAAALLGGPIGLIAGIGLAASAAAFSTYADLSDNIARRQLVNFSAAETLSGAVNDGDVEKVMQAMMLDTFISSNKVKAISPTSTDVSALVSKMSNRRTPELGVSIFPLMRFGSYAPIVAGLKMDGLIPIEEGPKAVASEASKMARGAIIEIFDLVRVLDYIGANIEDAQSGWRATLNSFQRTIESRKRAERALKARGARVR